VLSLGWSLPIRARQDSALHWVAYSAADSPSPLGAHQRPDTGAQGDAAVDRSIESSPFMKLHGNNISH